jgi:hypothetical protein
VAWKKATLAFQHLIVAGRALLTLELEVSFELAGQIAL